MVAWLKVQGLSSSPSTEKKKKKERKVFIFWTRKIGAWLLAANKQPVENNTLKILGK
jgi:hypothetical protein